MSGATAPGQPFDWNPVMLRTLFLARGYDVAFDDAWPGDDSGSITARRERGPRSHLVVVDAGGRFGARVTVTSGERGHAGEIGSIPVRVTETSQRLVMVSGRLEHPANLDAVLAALDEVADNDDPGGTSRQGEQPPL
ncbi:MAG: hypothetical protein ACKOWF_07480 [Chloroflexota bacterium]